MSHPHRQGLTEIIDQSNHVSAAGQLGWKRFEVHGPTITAGFDALRIHSYIHSLIHGGRVLKKVSCLVVVLLWCENTLSE